MSALKTARTSVSERARRYGPPGKEGGSSGRGPAAGRMANADKGAANRGKPAPPAKRPRSSRVVVRRIDPMSVLKVSALFYVSLCIALSTAAVLLWAGAHAVDLIANVENFMDEVGFTDFRLEGNQMMRAMAILSALVVLAGSIGNLLMAILYNLISDVIGGIKLVLAEDDKSHKR